MNFTMVRLRDVRGPCRCAGAPTASGIFVLSGKLSGSGEASAVPLRLRVSAHHGKPNVPARWSHVCDTVPTIRLAPSKLFLFATVPVVRQL